MTDEPEPQCKCDMRTKLVGDGCAVCNPELAAELMPQCIDGEAHDFIPWKTAPDGTLFYRCTKCKEESE